MTLHIFNTSPSNHCVFNDALPLISVEDIIVFIDDGVYASIKSSTSAEQIQKRSIKSYVLQESMIIRGLSLDKCVSQPITMDDLVQRVFAAKKTLSWY